MSNRERKERGNGKCCISIKSISLRDEIGTCPNIEVEIDVMDKCPLCIRPYHVKEKDKALIDKEMK